MSKNSDMGIRFYMVECDNKGKVLPDAIEKDLEKDFDGMLYSKAEGLDSVGKPRTYSEKYNDSDRLRVYLPADITHDATTVEFTFFFTGESKQAVYHEFLSYIGKGFHRYYDNFRKKYLYFFVNSEVKPAEEKHFGSTPYLKLDLTVQNIFGKTFDEPIK